MMKERWLVAVVGLPLLIAALIWEVTAPFVVIAIAGISAYELLKVAGGRGARHISAWVILSAWSQAANVGFYEDGMRTAVDALFEPVGLLILLFLIAIWNYGKETAVSFQTIAVAVVAGVVFPTMFGSITLLRMRENYGELYVLTPFFVAFAGDALAMYFGKWWGGKKLTPVSPNKTWAGFWGGILGSVLGMLLFGLVGGRWLGYPANYPRLALVGAVANLAGQLGDLSMSLIKREAGVKDYSRLFLAHGGMLDRFDSTLFIAPVVYFFVNLGIV